MFDNVRHIAQQIRSLLETSNQGLIINVRKQQDSSWLIPQHQAFADLEIDFLHGLGIWGARSAQNLGNFINDYSRLKFRIQGKWAEFLEWVYASEGGVGMLRIQLLWGKDPVDLDSHLWIATDPVEHCYYANGQVSGSYLDLDDTTSYGPENTRIQEVFTEGGNSAYYFKVHLWGGSLPSQGNPDVNNGLNRALVQLFSGISNVPFRQYYQEYDWPSASLRWWNVFEIDYSNRLNPIIRDNTSYSKGSSVDSYSSSPLLPSSYRSSGNSLDIATKGISQE